MAAPTYVSAINLAPTTDDTDSSHAFTATVPACDYLLLKVCGDYNSTLGVVSGVTVGGNACTLVTGGRFVPTSEGGQWIEAWYVAAPPTGSQTIAVTTSQNCRVTGWGAAFDDVDTGTPFGTVATQGGAASLTVSTGSSTADQTIVGTYTESFGPNSETDTTGGAVERVDFRTSDTAAGVTAGAFNDIAVNGQTKAGTGSGVTLTWSGSAGDWRAMMAVPVNGASGGGGGGSAWGPQMGHAWCRIVQTP
jgi:hypothetical protein